MNEMLGLYSAIISHYLSVNPNMTPIKQKKMTYSIEKNSAIIEEVDK